MVCLKNYQFLTLDGYYIGKITIATFEKSNLEKHSKTFLKRGNSVFINDFISENQSINIVLIKPKSPSLKSESFKKILKTSVDSKSFSKQELSKYLTYSGDKNAIHFGENPILPGILILDYILNYFSPIPSSFSIKFTNPIVLNNILYTSKITENELIGFTNENFVFQFTAY